MHRIRLHLAAVAAAFLAAFVLFPAAARADAGDVYPWSAPTEGPVKITDAHFFMYVFHMMECVSFKNATDKPIAALELRFRFFGRDGSVVEEPNLAHLLDDRFLRRARFER